MTKNEKGGPLGFIFNPYQSKIPKELEKDIYAAEAKTASAKDRNTRVALYAVLAFVGILCAFFNAFISELRTTEMPDGSLVSLESAGFGWVESNAFFRFVFMNKIGGYMVLLGGGAAGLLAEAELDTRRLNAEKIFEEMKRRKEAKDKKSSSNKQRSRRKKRRSGKETKRLGALSEIVAQEEEVTATEATLAADEKAAEKPEPEKKGGVFDSIKGFYEKADRMAETQALILNKELEDRGVIEKITDESGFKVVGREAASKLEKKEKEDDKQSQTDKSPPQKE